MPSPASPALHVGHRGPRACSPFSAASARMSGSELRATQSARHFSQKTCEHDVCTAWPYSTRLQHILHVNSETMDSSVSTSDSGKPIVRGCVACERPGGPLRRGNAPEACGDFHRLPKKNITRCYVTKTLKWRLNAHCKKTNKFRKTGLRRERQIQFDEG